MGWLEGLLTGYVDRSHEIEKQKMDEAVRSQEMEAKIYQQLLNSPDAKLKEMAAAGMLDMANPLRKTKGFKGWMGEVDRSPMLPIIRKYMQTPQEYDEETLVPGPPETVTEQRTIPKIGIEQARSQLPGYQPGPPPPPAPPASASLPSTSPTEAGGAPITPPATPPPPQGAQRLLAPPPGYQNPDPGLTVTPPPADPNQPQGAVRLVGEPPPQQVDTEALAAAPPPPPPPGLTPSPDGPIRFNDEVTVRGTRPPSPPWAAESFATSRQIPGQPVLQTETVSRLPHAFPTTSENAIAARRAQMTGDYQALTDMLISSGMPRAEAMQQAADEIIAMHQAGGRGSLPFQSMEIEYTDAAGQIHKTLGTYDKRQARYLDSQRNPIAGNVTKAVPASALSGGPYVNQAMYELHVTPLDMRNDQTVAARVNDRAAQIAAERAGGIVTEQGKARSGLPLSTEQRVGKQIELAGRWNTIRQPIRMMEMFLRGMEASYARYKAGDPTAWESLRTSFVHVSEPNSVVMPSEFQRASGSASIMMWIDGMIQQAAKGGAPLPDEQVDQMMDGARAIWANAQSFGAQERSAISATARDPLVNIPEEAIFGAPGLDYKPGAITPQPTTTPQTNPAPVVQPPNPTPNTTPNPAVVAPPPPPGTINRGSRIAKDPTGKLVIVPN